MQTQLERIHAHTTLAVCRILLCEYQVIGPENVNQNTFTFCACHLGITITWRRAALLCSKTFYGGQLNNRGGKWAHIVYAHYTWSTTAVYTCRYAPRSLGRFRWRMSMAAPLLAFAIKTMFYFVVGHFFFITIISYRIYFYSRSFLIVFFLQS